MELKKDYSLIGPSRAKAINSGLVNADWYKTPIKREMLKKVMKARKKYSVHDDHNKFKNGDKVSIRECKPFSKSKKFEVIRDLK